MTSHANIDWEGTRYLNKKEYDAEVRWSMQHDPNGHMNRNVYQKYSSKAAEAEKSNNARGAPQETGEQKDTQRLSAHLEELRERRRKSLNEKSVPIRGHGGFGVASKYESDPLVPAAVALRKDLHRREVNVDANTRAKERSSSSSFATAASVTNNGSSDTKDEDEAEASQRHVVHRKHKKNCPKHLLNELRRRNEAESKGMSPLPYSEVLDGPEAIPNTVGMTRKEILSVESGVDKLVKNTPFLVGRSMAYIFTGSYDPSQNVTKHRMESEHPNFAKQNAKKDREVLRSFDASVTREQKLLNKTEGGRDTSMVSPVESLPQLHLSSVSLPSKATAPCHDKKKTEQNGRADSSSSKVVDRYLESQGFRVEDINKTTTQNNATVGPSAAVTRNNNTNKTIMSGSTRAWASERPNETQRALAAAGSNINGRTGIFTRSVRVSQTDNEAAALENARTLEEANSRGNKTRNDGPHRHLTHTKVAGDPLATDPIVFDHFRRKYELKTHMEKMRSMGTGLLRDFANGKGFK